MLNKNEMKKWLQYFASRNGRKYPCSNQTVVCGIFSNKNVDEINQMMIQHGYIQDRHNLHRFPVWIPKDNSNSKSYERWYFFYDQYMCRGYRFYKVMIDKNIDEETFYQVILPCCDSYCCEMIFI